MGKIQLFGKSREETLGALVASLALVIMLSTTLFSIGGVVYAAGVPPVTPPTQPTQPAPTRDPLGSNCQDSNSCLNQNPIVQDIRLIIRVLSAGVGVVIAIGIILGGIRYITAGSDASAVNSAKKLVYNSVFALVIFLFMAAFIEWLTPGDLF